MTAEDCQAIGHQLRMAWYLKTPVALVGGLIAFAVADIATVDEMLVPVILLGGMWVVWSVMSGLYPWSMRL